MHSRKIYINESYELPTSHGILEIGIEAKGIVEPSLTGQGKDVELVQFRPYDLETFDLLDLNRMQTDDLREWVMDKMVEQSEVDDE